jgi:lysozyme
MFIDVSANNGKIDWTKVTGVEGVYIKANEGTGYNDPNLLANANGANSAGIPIGYYHFATLNSVECISDSTQEATWFVNSLTNLPKSTLPYALDIETNSIKLGQADVEKWINNFFATLENFGITDYVIYSYTPFLNANLAKGHSIGKYRLWVAAYAPHYLLPNGWSDAWAWQYDNKGQVPGITGNVDCSRLITQNA